MKPVPLKPEAFSENQKKIIGKISHRIEVQFTLLSIQIHC
jgi:hypothetical protein